MERSPYDKGIRDAIPIVSAYFPISMTFGVIATSGGIPWAITILISAWIYAGSAQFMLVSLALSGTSPTSTVITVLLVNLRHFLYGTTLGPSFMKWSEPKRWLSAFGLTDEVFAVTSSRFITETPLPAYQVTFTYICYISWLLGTIIGASIGKVVPSVVSDILSFALPALFVALLMLGNRSIPYFIAAILGAGLSVLADRLSMESFGIVMGALVGATCGMFLQRVSMNLPTRRS
ncbi:AzlC family ABC transporter permease [Sulfoacidibacillus thermotolerans]|uniref:Branched-chain amino acid transporter AzlC n=1 Tax=Sulfoacidibacillus thermotolerans TaxID=1765684 RepID=A0A2U3D885_SULT2|nr:AzlC family ABC transporter permease [Sulfoacidibacillus thermotolerans]PWI57496.1 branched-chain amino acid transporter AzlC [Sulfoacidibacillus thermotolerans]